MPSTSQAVRNIVRQDRLLAEGMQQEVLSYAAVAERIKKRVEAETGSSVKESAIIMALRRFREQTAEKEKPSDFDTEIIMKTGLHYLAFTKVPNYLERLLGFHQIIDDEKDTFNVIQGNYEIAIITNEKYAKELKRMIGSANLKNEEKDLVAISMTFGKDFAYTPGMIYAITRKLYWGNVNIFEMLTTATELTILFQQKYATKAYSTIYELTKSQS